MLERPPSRTARDRRYRQRQRDGVMTVMIEIDGAVVDMLARLRWLERRDVHERAEIARAIAAMIADAARRAVP